MSRKLAVLAAVLLLAGALSAQPERSLRASPDSSSLDSLLQSVHLYGCQTREHQPGSHDPCLGLRSQILAAAQRDGLRGALMARKRAFQQGAEIARAARSAKAAAEALDRRAAD